jgi:hypothetical protein
VYAGRSITSGLVLHGQLGNYAGEPMRVRRLFSAERGGVHLSNTITQRKREKSYSIVKMVVSVDKGWNEKETWR